MPNRNSNSNPSPTPNNASATGLNTAISPSLENPENMSKRLNEAITEATNITIVEKDESIVALNSIATLEGTPVQGEMSESSNRLDNIGLGVGILAVFLIIFYARLHVIPQGNEAFVRQGGLIKKKKLVSLDKSCIVIPKVHTLNRVPLNAFSLRIQCVEEDAVQTKDDFRADLIMSFQAWVEPSEERVSKAAIRLSKSGQISEENIHALLESSLKGIIRATTKMKNLTEINSDQIKFAEEINSLAQTNFDELGLTLNQVTISQIRANYNYDLDDALDAEGMRRHNEEIKENTKAAQERFQERVKLLETERELKKIEQAHQSGYYEELDQAVLKQQILDEKIAIQKKEEEFIEREHALIEKRQKFNTLRNNLDHSNLSDLSSNDEVPFQVT